MEDGIDLQQLLSPTDAKHRQVTLFALLCLGVIESLSSGSMGTVDATRLFFHAENCLFVRKHLNDKTADQIMSRGVQLQDLFDALPAEVAQREFQSELTTMHGLCLSLLEEKQVAA